MADETENQVPNIPNLTETIHEAEVREQFRRTEAKRARMATAAAQGAIPCGMVGEPRGAAGGAVGGGGGGGDAPADPRGEEDGITRTGPQGDRDRVEVAQMKVQMELMMTTIRALSTAPQGDRDRVEVAQMKVQMELMMTTIRALSTAQGAGGMGPAHGQAPPEAAQGVQTAQNTQELSLTHTSSDLFGSMADETENQVPKIPNLTETIHETVVRVREQFRRTEAERARMATAGSYPAWNGGGPAWSGWGSSRGGWRRRTSRSTGRGRWYHPGRPARGPGQGRNYPNEGPESSGGTKHTGIIAHNPSAVLREV
jgi:hypothetical protein